MLDILELDLSHLASVRQQSNEHVPDYISRFLHIEDMCSGLEMSDKELAELAYYGLLPHLRQEIIPQEYLDVNQVLLEALAQESCAKESRIVQESSEHLTRTSLLPPTKPGTLRSPIFRPQVLVNMTQIQPMAK
jgi:predicted transcriptional regulator